MPGHHAGPNKPLYRAGAACSPFEVQRLTGNPAWVPRSVDLPAAFQGHTREVLCVAISPDGQTSASGSAGDPIKFWDVATGKEQVALQGLSAACGWRR
jgi:WD40 repeat protein